MLKATKIALCNGCNFVLIVYSTNLSGSLSGCVPDGVYSAKNLPKVPARDSERTFVPELSKRIHFFFGMRLVHFTQQTRALQGNLSSGKL